MDIAPTIVRFSQGKTARLDKNCGALPTSTPSDRPGRWKLLADFGISADAADVDAAPITLAPTVAEAPN